MADRLYELEITSIHKLLTSHFMKKDNLNELLFVNFYPSTIMHPEFPKFMNNILNQYPMIKNKMVIEIIETEKVNNIFNLRKNISILRDLGFCLAIDDIGSGWSTLSMIIEVEPDYIKLDRYFANGLSTSSLKQEMIKSLMSYSAQTNTKVILEGLEKDTDLAVAKSLGIEFCQGFLLNLPKPFY